MDKGTFAERGYEVRPGLNGSYVLMLKFYGDRPALPPHEIVGFTNAFDLLAFLKEDHTVHFTDGPEPSTE